MTYIVEPRTNRVKGMVDLIKKDSEKGFGICSEL